MMQSGQLENKKAVAAGGGGPQKQAVHRQKSMLECVCTPTWLAAWVDANNPSPWQHSSGFVRASHRWLGWLEGTVWERRPNNRQQLRSSPCFPVTSSLSPPNAGQKGHMEVCRTVVGFLELRIKWGVLLKLLRACLVVEINTGFSWSAHMVKMISTKTFCWRLNQINTFYIKQTALHSITSSRYIYLLLIFN